MNEGGLRQAGGRRQASGSGRGRAGFHFERRWIAPGLSALGLLVAAAMTLVLFTGRLPWLGPPAGGGGGGGSPAPSGGTARTPDPVIVNPVPKTNVVGSILFAKAGNVWMASGEKVTQLSTGGRDSSPAWSAGGSWIYLVETKVREDVRVPDVSRPARFYLRYPVIVRMHPDGSGREVVQESLYRFGSGNRYTYHAWYLQPAPAPDGRQVAVISDAPEPLRSDTVVQLIPATGGEPVRIAVPSVPTLGHADPAWRSDGAVLAFTHHGRDGSDPAPQIYVWVPATNHWRAITAAGYSQPSWSPDGRFLAAVRARGNGRDVVILDAKTGDELLQLTDDGLSWAPAWSPAGDAVAYLHAEGRVIDLAMVTLTGSGPAFAVDERLPITEDSGLDGTSRPSWFVPPELLPSPTPTPSPTASPAPSATGSAGTPSPGATP